MTNLNEFLDGKYALTFSDATKIIENNGKFGKTVVYYKNTRYPGLNRFRNPYDRERREEKTIGYMRPIEMNDFLLFQKESVHYGYVETNLGDLEIINDKIGILSGSLFKEAKLTQFCALLSDEEDECETECHCGDLCLFCYMGGDKKTCHSCKMGHKHIEDIEERKDTLRKLRSLRWIEPAETTKVLSNYMSQDVATWLVDMF